ncbi:hypothetical protein [Legionella bononiensis]|uniref:VipA n=1 Tax=Legionella bononiensis TaxID=2793102 RepID=A0ABS1W9A3_9GAMM|nr:hypothetical protein [Legionella bononiensis]MBL7480886.1 hypothetical protein [Legionella bononiensis]MBL7525932.1 hypothetical protein [Legionella bononiensis]MBL7564001.1 hypothetical protein [Legionella bononiensis]
MPLSKEFLSSFNKFVTHYKQTGASSMLGSLGWGKEQNHSGICSYFEEILTLISSNQEAIHDASVIEYITIPINLSAKTNPYLLDCWSKSLIEYNSGLKVYTPISAMKNDSSIHIQIAPDGTSSERMMRDLRLALDSTQKAQEYSRVAYLSELELLKKQNEELKNENAQLTAENRHLREQVQNDQLFRSLQPQISTARSQLASFAELLNTLHEITGGRPSSSDKITVVPSSIHTNEALINATPSIQVDSPVHESEHNKHTTAPSPIPPHTNSMQSSSSDPGSTSTPPVAEVQKEVSIPLVPIKTPPKNPPPPPPVSNKPAEPSRVFNGEGFFKELTEELAKRNQPKNKASTSTPSPASGEKKSM